MAKSPRLGIDIVDVARFTQRLEQNPGLAARLFAPEELAQLGSVGAGAEQTSQLRRRDFQRLAGWFAAKEATLKALGTPERTAWTDLRITHDDTGAPQLDLQGGFAQLAQEQQVANFAVSVSHDGPVALAVVVATFRGAVRENFPATGSDGQDVAALLPEGSGGAIAATGVEADEPEQATPDLTLTKLVRWMHRPLPADHKYSRGVVSLRVGSPQYPGAAVLATGGAQRSGVGMVRLWDPSQHLVPYVIAAAPDVVVTGGQEPTPAGMRPAHSWVVGSGLGLTGESVAHTLAVLQTELPVVLDAEALRMLADSHHAMGLRLALRRRAQQGHVTILTPHEGEFAALGYHVPGEDAPRRHAAIAAAQDLQAILVLKGHRTVVALPNGRSWRCEFTSAALATAGTGDIYAGMLGGLLAHMQARGQLQLAGTGEHLEVAGHIALLASTWHALAAQLVAGQHPVVTAPDVVAALPTAAAYLLQHRADV